MAIVAHLVTRTPAGGRELVNDVAAFGPRVHGAYS